MDHHERRIRFRQALEQSAINDTITNAALAVLWGGSASAFSAIRRNIADFPSELDDLVDAPASWNKIEAIKAVLRHIEAAMRVETPLPRGAGADAPQSEIPAGAMPLMYTEQNFNELAAANTALQSELAGAAALIDEKQSRINDLQKMLDQAQEMADKIAGDAAAAQLKMDRVIADLKKQLVVEEANHGHTKRLLEAANQRVARASGYIDRVLDDEARLDPPVKIDRPMPPAPKGPALNDIWDPPAPTPARGQATDSDWVNFAGPVRHAEGEYAPRRRY